MEKLGKGQMRKRPQCSDKNQSGIFIDTWQECPV